MLIRNCEATSLLREGDFNVRVTIFDRNPKFYTPEAYKAAWIETIRDSMGGMLVNSKETFKFHIQIASAKGFQEITGPSSDLISLLRSEAYPKPMSLRIDVVKSKNKMHSWIFIVDNSDNSVEDKYLLPESEISCRIKYYLKRFGEEYSPYSIHTKKRQMYVLSLKHNDIKFKDLGDAWIEMIMYGLKESDPELLFSSHTRVVVRYYDATIDQTNTSYIDSGNLLDYLYSTYRSEVPCVLGLCKLSDVGIDKYIYFLAQDLID